MKIKVAQKTPLTVALAVASCLLMSAHFLRAADIDTALLSAVMPALFLVRRRWSVNVLFLWLTAAVLIWFFTAYDLIHFRMIHSLPWLRPAAIFTAVIALTLYSALGVLAYGQSDRFSVGPLKQWPSTAAFFLTAALIIPARIKAPVPVLLADRLFIGAGWIEILILSSYAAWITRLLFRADDTSLIRMRIWRFFSIVFFLQLILGLLGMDVFLMTGRLHLPIPALIVGGPLYRGSGYFMPILFAATVLLAGPAWCSYLCYFGVWDNTVALKRRKPVEQKPWMRKTRAVVLILIIAAALIMRLLNVPSAVAVTLALLFGIGGIAVIVQLSREKGIMVHCLAYCPIGLLADLLGKISPFRIRLNGSCNECRLCKSACRYGALGFDDIAQRRPGITCTLCGDCIAGCGKNAIGYSFLFLRPETARMLFIVIVVSLHAAFLGLARI